MTELRTEPESSQTSSRRKNAVNGFKRASRRQAAIVGLAVLMGASFLGCHSGPRLFAKKDRDERAAKKELAEKDNDKSKFINRKKVRPESDYRDDTDEQIAKSDSKSKSKSTDAGRKPSKETADRAVASRQQPDAAKDTSSRSAKATANQPKTSKSADREEFARRDTGKRPVTDLLSEDSLFDDKLPETRSTTKGTATANSPSRSAAAKAKSLDEDPFKDSVIGSTATKQPDKKVATVNFFDDEDLDDEMEEAAEELESLRVPTAKKTVTKTAAATDSSNRRATATASPSNRKFLDEIDAPADGSFRSLILDEVPEVTDDESIAPPDVRTVKRTTEAAKTVAGQKVVDRRQQVQQTLDGWRREMDRDDSFAGSEEEASVPTPSTATHSTSGSTAKGHISQASIDEFATPAKSQGAVLNGELIIDTNSLPSRFQRSSGRSTEPSSPSGESGRMNSNSGANIEIVPGATQNRTRPAGQISLQSASEEDAATGLTTAGYEQTTESNNLGQLPSLTFDTNSDAGPKLSAMDDETSIAPTPPEELSDHAAGIGLAESSSGSRVWKRTLIVFAAMASAVAIGFGLRRRMELVLEPIRVPKQPRNDPQDPASWPRG